MADVSGFGLVIQIVADRTFPQGVTITQLADDVDPFDIPSITIRDKSMGLNGDLLTWNKGTPIEMSLAVVPGSADDANLSALFEANRVGRGKFSANDVITVTGIYPDGSTVSLVDGAITDGQPGSGVASSGRLKSKTYKFAFENRVGS